MVDVIDTLVGNNSVIVKTEDESFEFGKEHDRVFSTYEELPNEVSETLQSRGFTIEPNFQSNITIYAHDEPTQYDKQEIAEDLGVKEDHSLAQDISYITSEIPIGVEVEEDGSWKVTHVYGKELKEPYSY